MSSMKRIKSIGDRIKTVRIKNSLTQQAFAKSLGIAQSYLSELEKGIKTPSDTILIALSYRYEINIDWLYKGKGAISDSNIKQLLKLDFIKEIIEAVEIVVEREKAKLSPNKKAEIVILLYEKLHKEEADFKGKGRETVLADNIIKFLSLAS